MFKGRLGVWITILVVVFVGSWLIGTVPGWFHDWFHKDAVTVMANVSDDRDFSTVLSNKTISDNYETVITDAEPDIIITDDVGIKLDNYTKHEDYVYSPIVLYAKQVYSYSEGFIPVPNTSNCYKVDLYGILTAIENGKNWDSLGINKKVVNGAVTLYIPNEQNSYYDEVIDLFYLTLNNGNAPTEEERAALAGRVNTILSKCHKVADIGQAVYEEYDNESKEGKVFIGPEYLYQRGKGYSMGTGDNNSRAYSSFRPVYPINTVYLKADVYVRNADADNSNEIYAAFVEKMRTDSDFMYSTGWRVKNYSFSVSNVYYANP